MARLISIPGCPEIALIRESRTGSGFVDSYVYSADMRYRYGFQRRWAETGDRALDTIVWVLLNPGTGDTDGRPRATLARCLAWSASWHYASLTIINLFAYRSTDSKKLRTAVDPIGPYNDLAIRSVVAHATRIVVAWGWRGSLLDRADVVARLLDDTQRGGRRGATPMCLGVTTWGQPLHPLHVVSGASLQPWHRGLLKSRPRRQR